jgi:hypothetical protein
MEKRNLDTVPSEQDITNELVETLKNSSTQNYHQYFKFKNLETQNEKN